MAYGQIDPTRLRGEALRQWYLRSPAEIEDERRRAADRAYDNFFSRPDSESQTVGTAGAKSAALAAETPWQRASHNRWRAERVGTDSAVRRSVGLADPRVPATPETCLTCHGRSPIPPPAPWPLGPVFGPIGTLPSLRDIPGVVPSGSDGGNPKQCVVQYDNDSAICRQLPTEGARFRCWESAAEREAHCIKTKGEVGSPSLKTK